MKYTIIIPILIFSLFGTAQASKNNSLKNASAQKCASEKLCWQVKSSHQRISKLKLKSKSKRDLKKKVSAIARKISVLCNKMRSSSLSSITAAQLKDLGTEIRLLVIEYQNGDDILVQ